MITEQMKEQNICDLHVHSNCSDGSSPPESLIALAREAGVAAVALCDHNTLSGLERFEAAAVGTNVAAVPGVEVTAEYRGHEVHVLGLFIPHDARAALKEYLRIIARRKGASNRELVERLAADGFDIDLDAVLAAAGEALPNRVHVANVLMARGYVASVGEAFKTLIRDGGRYYQSPKRLNAFEVVAFLAEHRVLPVLAHPCLTLSPEEIDSFLPEAKACGLVGVETIYPLYSHEETAFMADAAARWGLLPSGGSDFHGSNKPDIRMGVGRDNIRVPLSFFERLRERAEW